MSQFVLFAALLALLAIAFAVSALWQRSRGLAIGLALGLPILAAGLYYFTGQPAALDPKNIAQPTNVEDAIAQLQRRIADDPNDAANLVVLARFYMASEKFSEARDTYARAVKLLPEDSDLAVEYAESQLRSSADRRFPPAAVALLETAVARNPQNQRALFFLGMQRMQDGRPAEAAQTWEQLLPLLNPETSSALREQIVVARAAAGMPALPPSAESAGRALVTVTVEIDPMLAGLAKPGDTLYVFARNGEGSGPPVAVKRLRLDSLPVRVQLGDGDSPMPAAKLSAQKSVILMARLSKSGDATPASGDIEADPLVYSLDEKQPARLLLTRAVP